MYLQNMQNIECKVICIFISINQSIKVFLVWPKWRSRCKVHYRCKKSVTEARKRLAEQMSFQLSLEVWQRFSGNDVVGKRVFVFLV